MKIALATDHTGYQQLQEIKKWLESHGHECQNFGPTQLVQEDDYPDYIFPAAKAVANGTFERGIIFGGSGQGEAMAANRVNGVRCMVFYGPAVARKVVDAEGHVNHDPFVLVRLSRQHNNSNILSIAARFVSLEDMKHVVKIWLETPFLGEERHQRRNQKLDEAI